MCYVIHMKAIQERQKANDLKLGCIYINGTTGQPCRLVNIVSCEGAWLESYDGQGYGETISFDDVLYADQEEVQDFLEDLAVYEGKTKGHKDSPIPQWQDWGRATVQIQG